MPKAKAAVTAFPIDQVTALLATAFVPVAAPPPRVVIEPKARPYTLYIDEEWDSFEEKALVMRELWLRRENLPRPIFQKIAQQPRRKLGKSYRVLRSNDARVGTWRRHMLACILQEQDVANACKRHSESGDYSNRTLDFNWAAKAGYISWKG